MERSPSGEIYLKSYGTKFSPFIHYDISLQRSHQHSTAIHVTKFKENFLIFIMWPSNISVRSPNTLC